MIIKVKTVEELDNLISNSKSLVLDFYADWCGPCKNLGKLLEKLMNQSEYKDVVFCKLDVDNSEFEETCMKFGVSGIPHVEFFKNSKKVTTLVGYNESKLIENIKAIL
jgi:thioredoxin 1